MRWLDCITDAMNMNLGQLREMVGDREAWCAVVHGVTKSQTSVSSYPSAFFMVQLSQPYMTTEKTMALTTQTFVGRAMSLLSNTLSRFVIHLCYNKYVHIYITCTLSSQMNFKYIFTLPLFPDLNVFTNAEVAL